MKLTDLKLNPANPRLIKDDRFKKLVKSIQDFPAMMSLRPMVVNKDIPDEWVKITDGLTPDEEKRFIIEDNVPFGEWDYDILANEWNVDELAEEKDR